jgi:two-component system, OmpR family, response regulator ChvI
MRFEDSDVPYDDFPVILSNRSFRSESGNNSDPTSLRAEVCAFPGQSERYCVCFVDIVNSTIQTAPLSGASYREYIGPFLNKMALIARNFAAEVTKIAGDGLIFYFPQTSNASDTNSFRNVLECGITMMAAHKHINARLSVHDLPSLSYRISADYGPVEVAKSSTLQNYDLFGRTMNVCSKINSKASPNGMVIGHNLYEVVRTLDGYIFNNIGMYLVGREQYAIYSVKSKDKRNILDPFTRGV